MIIDAVTVTDFLSPDECDRISAAYSGKVKPSKLFDDKVIDSIRVSKNTFLDPAIDQEFEIVPIIQKIIDTFTDVVKYKFHFLSTVIHDIQYAEYKKDDFYTWHMDSGENLNESTYPYDRDFSASVILSPREHYLGGNLQFKRFDNWGNPFSMDISESQGCMIVFPSMMTHRVKPVESGLRKSLVIWSKRPDLEGYS